MLEFNFLRGKATHPLCTFSLVAIDDDTTTKGSTSRSILLVPVLIPCDAASFRINRCLASVWCKQTQSEPSQGTVRCAVVHYLLGNEEHRWLARYTAAAAETISGTVAHRRQSISIQTIPPRAPLSVQLKGTWSDFSVLRQPISQQRYRTFWTGANLTLVKVLRSWCMEEALRCTKGYRLMVGADRERYVTSIGVNLGLSIRDHDNALLVPTGWRY